MASLNIPKLSLIHPNNFSTAIDRCITPSPPSIKRKGSICSRDSLRYNETPPLPNIPRSFDIVSNFTCKTLQDIWYGVDQIYNKQRTVTQVQRL